MDIKQAHEENGLDLDWRIELSEKEYDLVIFGGGPSGLALAQCVSRIGQKVLIVEREQTLGGCHRVEWFSHSRSDSDSDSDANKSSLWFSEHGPRVYISDFNTLWSLLKEVGYTREELFQPIDLYDKFRKQDGMTEMSFSLKELMHLTSAFFSHIFTSSLSSDTPFKYLTVKTFMDYHRFSEETQWYLDTICRLTDGGGVERYSMFQLMDFFDISMTKQLMQPRVPNDHPEKGFISLWQKHLIEKNGVDILTGWKLEHFDTNENVEQENEIQSALIRSYDEKKNKVKGKKYVLAMPPESFRTILKESGDNRIQNAFGPYNDFERYSSSTRYDDYLCFSLFWTNPEKIERVQKKEKERDQTPYTPWGIFSMHMDFASWNPDIFILSCCMSRTNTRSPHIQKTINECELIEEWLVEGARQTIDAFGLPSPDMQVPFDDVFKDNGKWRNNTTGFFHAAGESHMPFQSVTLHNLYQVGTQNGKQKYNVTTIESAVSNSVALAHYLYPETKKFYQIYGPGLRVRHVVFIGFLTAIIIFFIVAHFIVKFGG